MTSAKIYDFWTPLPLVTVTNQLNLFLSSAIWGPTSPPPTADVKYGSPLKLKMDALCKTSPAVTSSMAEIQIGRGKKNKLDRACPLGDRGCCARSEGGKMRSSRVKNSVLVSNYT